MELKVSSLVIEVLLSEARDAAPNEACGLLLGHGLQITSTQPTKNVHLTPKTHFEIDPQALIDAHRAARSGGPEIVGYYHSHPVGPPEPSATDQAMAAADGKVWAIVGSDQVKFWRDVDGGFEPLCYALSDG